METEFLELNKELWFGAKTIMSSNRSGSHKSSSDPQNRIEQIVEKVIDLLKKHGWPIHQFEVFQQSYSRITEPFELLRILRVIHKGLSRFYKRPNYALMAVFDKITEIISRVHEERDNVKRQNERTLKILRKLEQLLQEISNKINIERSVQCAILTVNEAYDQLEGHSSHLNKLLLKAQSVDLVEEVEQKQNQADEASECMDEHVNHFEGLINVADKLKQVIDDQNRSNDDQLHAAVLLNILYNNRAVLSGLQGCLESTNEVVVGAADHKEVVETERSKPKHEESTDRDLFKENETKLSKYSKEVLDMERQLMLLISDEKRTLTNIHLFILWLERFIRKVYSDYPATLCIQSIEDLISFEINKIEKLEGYVKKQEIKINKYTRPVWSSIDGSIGAEQRISDLTKQLRGLESRNDSVYIDYKMAQKAFAYEDRIKLVNDHKQKKLMERLSWHGRCRNYDKELKCLLEHIDDCTEMNELLKYLRNDLQLNNEMVNAMSHKVRNAHKTCNAMRIERKQINRKEADLFRALQQAKSNLNLTNVEMAKWTDMGKEFGKGRRIVRLNRRMERKIEIPRGLLNTDSVMVKDRLVDLKNTKKRNSLEVFALTRRANIARIKLNRAQFSFVVGQKELMKAQEQIKLICEVECNYRRLMEDLGSKSSIVQNRSCNVSRLNLFKISDEELEKKIENYYISNRRLKESNRNLNEQISKYNFEVKEYKERIKSVQGWKARYHERNLKVGKALMEARENRRLVEIEVNLNQFIEEEMLEALKRRRSIVKHVHDTFYSNVKSINDSRND
ncbi:hypothetical protein ACOME3_001797 [Neoechinorhynchus agilis]